MWLTKRVSTRTIGTRRIKDNAVPETLLDIPWRHRLRNGERREFVMAELRHRVLTTGGSRSRSAELDKQRAINAARCPKDSKFGECLVNVHTKRDPILASRLTRLTAEMRRMEFKMQQQKQHFVRTTPSLNHEPLILVERPASPHVRLRAKFIDDYGEDPSSFNMPSYMRPLRSRCRTPSTLTTIDAFTLKAKKKRNVWEEAMDEKAPPQFQSTVRPAARLSRREMTQLQEGWSSHKVRVDDLGAKDNDSSPRTSAPRAASTDPRLTDTLFLTQLPRKELPTTADGRLLRTVAISQLTSASPATSLSKDAPATSPADKHCAMKIMIEATPTVLT